MKTRLLHRNNTIGLMAVLLPLAAIYFPTLQTIPNGSSHYYMIDVGETQIVLNTWGTLHATGYPHYVITGNLFTGLLRLPGVDAAAAPGLVSMFWGLAALALVYVMVLQFTGRLWLAMGTTFLLGLTRTLWLHSVIAEIYTFGFVLLVGLLMLALWRYPITGRIYWMALIGGIAVAHHRLLIVIIPALLYAVYPYLLARRGQLPRIIIFSLLIGLLGFLPYLYLPLRAWTGADWVYGEPGTFSGFVDQFFGLEGQRFVRMPESLPALLDNMNIINTTLIEDLTVPGLVFGLLGLAAALRVRKFRRAAGTFLILALTAYLFHVLLWWTDPMPALILPVTLAVFFGGMFLVDIILTFQVMVLREVGPAGLFRYRLIFPAAGMMLAVVFMVENYWFVYSLTHDPTGLETIEQVRAAPPGATAMLAWGPRYFAAAFAHDIQGDLQHIRIVDDKVDFRPIADDGLLVTPEYTFYQHPAAWWEDRLNARVYLRAVSPHLVEIGLSPETAENPPEGITAAAESVTCEADRLVLEVTWQTSDQPAEDLSVFVHALDGDGQLVAQGDQFAPVYGWRPLTTWTPGEMIRDVYLVVLDGETGVESVNYGLYHILPEGGFENVLEMSVPVECG